MISITPARALRAEPRPLHQKRRDIQGLRALAVLLVIGNHAGLPGFGGGYIGVDIFFVISGYVITQLLLKESNKGLRRCLSDFYSRRVRRIVPAATVTLAGTLIVARMVLGSQLDPRLPTDVRWASLFGANLRFISTGTNYFVPGLHPSLVTQFWSLAVEEQFYLLFPLVVFAIARAVTPAARNKVLTIVVAAGVGASAAWSAVTTASHPVTAYYSPTTRFWELGLGCILATTTYRRPRRVSRREPLAAWAGSFVLLVALIDINSRSTYPGVLAWLPCGGTALLIWSGRSGPRTPVGRALSTRPMAYIGDISYSLYLVHFVWLKLPEQIAVPLTGGGWRLIEIAGLFFTAVASYHLVENPIRNSPRLARDGAAVALLLGVCIATSWVVADAFG